MGFVLVLIFSRFSFIIFRISESVVNNSMPSLCRPLHLACGVSVTVCELVGLRRHIANRLCLSLQ